MKTRQYLIKIIWCAVIILFAVGCSTSEEVFDEDYVPTEEDIVETLKKVNTEWGTSKESIMEYMKGYKAVDSSDEDILQFTAKKLPVTIAYQFSSGNLCSAVMMLKKEEDNSDFRNILGDFDYIGDYYGKGIYTNTAKNVFAVTYENDEEEEKCQVIGFTPYLAVTEVVNGVECADLGLSVKWATCNVGAESSEEYGGYYAWGETEEKNTYSWNTYNYCSGSSSTCESIGDSINGTLYDVATANLGSFWAIPTKAEMNELSTKCDWVWTAVNGIKGYKVFGGNGNYIFLPAAGFKQDKLKSNGTRGMYLTATQGNNIYHAITSDFSSSKRDLNSIFRYYGCSVRAVLKK